MKQTYDRQTELPEFSPGDRLLALLPLVTSPFQAKYCGPFTVLCKVSELNYLIETPGNRKSLRLRHVNLLKPCHSHCPDQGLSTMGSALATLPVTVHGDLDFLEAGRRGDR